MMMMMGSPCLQDKLLLLLLQMLWLLLLQVSLRLLLMLPLLLLLLVLLLLLWRHLPLLPLVLLWRLLPLPIEARGRPAKGRWRRNSHPCPRPGPWGQLRGVKARRKQRIRRPPLRARYCCRRLCCERGRQQDQRGRGTNARRKRKRRRRDFKACCCFQCERRSHQLFFRFCHCPAAILHPLHSSCPLCSHRCPICPVASPEPLHSYRAPLRWPCPPHCPAL